MLKRADGRIAHIETEYNDMFITKRRNQLTMSFQIKGWDYTESVINLLDADDLPLRYAQVMTIAIIYPADAEENPDARARRRLDLDLSRPLLAGGHDHHRGDRSRRDQAAKTYFGLRETDRMRYLAGDGRVFLNRNSELYDLILLDAYRGGYVPFHLLTREFYALVKQRLAPGGAAAFNVHDGTKLYASTVKTLGDVFPTLDLYPTGLGEVIAVATASPASTRKLWSAGRRAAGASTGSDFRCRKFCNAASTTPIAGGEQAISSPTILPPPMSMT